MEDQIKIYLFIAALIAIVGYPVAKYNAPDIITITVEDKERITTGSGDSMSSKYLVFTDKGVFENTDAILFGKFDSADLQNELKKGETYTVKVYGWRVPFFSMYRNIVEIK